MSARRRTGALAGKCSPRAPRFGADSLSQEQRLRRALLIIGVALAAVVGSSAVAAFSTPGVVGEAAAMVAEEGSAGLIEWAEDAGGVAPVFSQLAGGMGGGASGEGSNAGDGVDGEGYSCLPEGFEDETFAVGAYDDVRVSGESSLVGFSCEGSKGDVFASLADELTEKGWSEVPSGIEGCATFSRGEGRYRWLMLACAQVGATTSVVVQYAQDNEGA